MLCTVRIMYLTCLDGFIDLSSLVPIIRAEGHHMRNSPNPCWYRVTSLTCNTSRYLIFSSACCTVCNGNRFSIDISNLLIHSLKAVEVFFRFSFCEIPLKIEIPRHLIQFVASGKPISDSSHNSVCNIFWLHAVVGNCEKYKFGSSFQWLNNFLNQECLFFSVGKGAKNALPIPVNAKLCWLDSVSGVYLVIFSLFLIGSNIFLGQQGLVFLQALSFAFYWLEDFTDVTQTAGNTY